ncbi:unnamed protein product, partial [Meganyctiphanes norvegica]
VPGQSTDIDNPSSTTHSLEVGWSPSEDNACPITSYTVKWSSDSGGEGQEEGVTNTQHNITGLKPCIKYTITVIAYTEKGAGPESDPETFTTDTDLPGQVTGVENKGITSDSLLVNWTSPESPDNPCHVTKYTVQWVDVYGKLQEASDIEPPYIIENLTDCSNYTITVTAFTEKGNGKTSEPVDMTTGPKDVYIEEVYNSHGSRNASISWKRPEIHCPLSFVVNYTGITQWTNNKTTVLGDPQTVEDSNDPKANITAELTDLLPYTEYNVCVTVGDENTICETFETDKEVPDIPRNVIITDGSVTDTSVTLTWWFPVEENGILENYNISWSRRNDIFDSASVEADVDTYTITGLGEGNYSITVKVNNSMGFSEESEAIYCPVNGAK